MEAVVKNIKFKVYHGCDKRNISTALPNWRVLCVGCFIDKKDKDLKGKCLIKIKRV